MAKIAEVQYQGNLRTEAKHLASGNKITNDAPVDNKGKGEAFSPTDMVATALPTCMLTVMGIRAQKEGFDLEGASAEVSKEMASDPRRISKVIVHLRLKANCDSKMQKILEGVGRNCPVAKSLHPDLEQEVSFEWS